MKDISASTAKNIARRVFTSGIEMVTVDGDAWPEEKPLPEIYGAPDGFPAGCWVAYVGKGDRVGASTIVVIRKPDGEIIFHGQTGE